MPIVTRLKRNSVLVPEVLHWKKLLSGGRGRAGEMAQQLEVIAVLAEDPGSMPSIHTEPQLSVTQVVGDLVLSKDADLHSGTTPRHINKAIIIL